MSDILNGMKSFVVFSPNDTQEETERKWVEWLINNDKISAVGDKYVPSLEETRKMLMRYEHENI